MFGGRKKRIEKLSAGAAGNLEPGEEIREVVQTQTGQSAGANATAVGTSGLVSGQTGIAYRSKVRAVPHVLVATDRNLYAMALSGARLLDVGEVVMRVPLDQADLHREKNRLIFDGETFFIMATFGEYADRLVKYVSSFRTAGEPSSQSASSS
jgi:hypothetical protein